MPKIDFDRHVPFSPEQMLQLVTDLKSYPNFVPNCENMDVDRGVGETSDVHYARMGIKFGPISQAYTSKVTVAEDGRTVSVKAVDGPFSHLDSQWRFEPENSGTRVRFDIDFAISNRLIATIAEPAFALKQREIVDAFIAEARRRYS